MNDIQNPTTEEVILEDEDATTSLPTTNSAPTRPTYDDDEEEQKENDNEYGNQATFALESLQTMIRQKLTVIERSQVDLNEYRTRLNDMLANSEEYYKADKATKEALKVKKQIKATIMSTEEAKAIQEKLDADKELLNEQQEGLSDMLLEYYETLRVKEIDDESGEPRDLKVSVKIMPKKFVKR